MTEKFSVKSNCEEETRQIAQKIARYFLSGDIIILDGELGAGKTYFVKGFIEGLHSQDLVSSPTFSIANFYRTDTTDLLHIDLYRILTVDDFNDLGLHDYFEQSIVMIEWGKKFADFFDAYLLISIEINDDNTRTLHFTNQGDKHTPTMADLKKLLKGEIVC